MADDNPPQAAYWTPQKPQGLLQVENALVAWVADHQNEIINRVGYRHGTYAVVFGNPWGIVGDTPVGVAALDGFADSFKVHLAITINGPGFDAVVEYLPLSVDGFWTDENVMWLTRSHVLNHREVITSNLAGNRMRFATRHQPQPLSVYDKVIYIYPYPPAEE